MIQQCLSYAVLWPLEKVAKCQAGLEGGVHQFEVDAGLYVLCTLCVHGPIVDSWFEIAHHTDRVVVYSPIWRVQLTRLHIIWRSRTPHNFDFMQWIQFFRRNTVDTLQWENNLSFHFSMPCHRMQTVIFTMFISTSIKTYYNTPSISVLKLQWRAKRLFKKKFSFPQPLDRSAYNIFLFYNACYFLRSGLHGLFMLPWVNKFIKKQHLQLPINRNMYILYGGTSGTDLIQ